ncbi:MAG: glycosyltransferase [Paludibacter sp.]|nr:glycosyltransferase [Paludibacter sp.]
MQNIGLFNDSYPPIIDGVAVTVQNYAKWMYQHERNVCVVTPKAPDYIDTDPFPVYRYPSIPLVSRKPYRLGLPDIDIAFQTKLEKIPFSLVHAHCPFTSGLLALKIAKERKIPLVATFHTKYRDNFEQALHSKKLVDLMVKELVYFYNQADEVWIPQESVEETLREYGYKGKLVVMNNGTDFCTNQDSEVLKKEAREKLGINGDELVLLYVGQLVWEKNLRLIMDALSKNRQTNFRMIFVGTGYAENELKMLAENMQLSSRIEFPGLISDRQMLRNYYAAADLFLFPSLYDTWALVVREAAALYTPSLLLKKSIAASDIIDNVNGFLIEENPDVFASKLDTLSMNKQLLSETGVNAAKSLTKSWEKIVSEVLDRYEYLIKINRK